VICLQLQLAQQTCHHSPRELEEGSEYFNPEISQDVIAQISKAVSFYFILPRVWQKSEIIEQTLWQPLCCIQRATLSPMTFHMTFRYKTHQSLQVQKL